VGVDVAMLQAAADLVERTLAQIAFDVLVDEANGPLGLLVEHIQHVLDTLQVSGLRQIVVNDHVAIDSGRHDLPHFGSWRYACWPCSSMYLAFVAESISERFSP